MTPEEFKRKLTAILSADVEGYSRLMSADEASTVRTLTTYREIIASLIKQHRGRVVDAPGDNVLAEFASVVDAAQCAVAVQKEIQSRNVDLPEERKMVFRIGINLGDVIEEDERIYGDGVNVAARLEALCDPGGICISKTAFDQIESKLPLGYEYIGEQTVKNIPKPVGAYRVLMEPRVTAAEGIEKKKSLPLWRKKPILAGCIAVIIVIIALAIWNLYLRGPSIEPASQERMAFPLPEKPSIAVLPFRNMSNDPEQDYIGDGLSENITSALSKIGGMFVIASNSTFTYKAKPVKVQQVAEDLGVQYILEGSVQKSGEHLRLTAQLIDALTGHHLWSEKYDRKMEALFDLQDEITKKIVVSLEVELTRGGEALIEARATNNLEAWSKVAKGYNFWIKQRKEDNKRALKLFQEAVELDPTYATAWAWIGWAHYFDAAYGWSESPAESLRFAHEAGQKALTIDDQHPYVFAMQGNMLLYQREYDKALAKLEKSVAIDPNYYGGHHLLAGAMFYLGRFEESLELSKKAMRLCPHYPAIFLSTLGRAYTHLGRYDEAIKTLNQLDDRCRKGECPEVMAQLGLAQVYAELGRVDEARTYMAEALKFNPKMSLESFKRVLPFKNPAHLQRELDAFRTAGMPERQPLPLPDKPSIAVLPFTNMSGDPAQEYIGDGLSENIISALSKVSKMFVISRNSTFTYKGKPVKVQEVAEELGVQYVLEGSVQKSGDRLRVTAQLIDAQTGHHRWSEKYDREMKDLFDLQDEITKKIVVELQVELTYGEMARVYARDTENMEAWSNLVKGIKYSWRMNKEDILKGRKFIEQAIELDAK